MNLRKRHYKDKQTGERREVTAWTVRFRDHQGVTRELPAFVSKRASEELGKRLDRLAELCAAGAGPDSELIRWLEQAPHGVITRLVKWGLVKPHRLAGIQPLSQHLENWKSSLLAKGNTKAHAELVVSRAKKVTKACGFHHYVDLDADRVQQFLSDRRTVDRMAAQTSNFYLQAVKQFCRWMVRQRRATDNPLAYLTGLNVRTDRRHDRRALSLAETHGLLRATEHAAERFGMTDPQRAVVYRLALETGLRASEIRSLTVTSFGLNCKSGTVTVQAAYSKHRREDVLPLRPEMVTLLKQYLARRMPHMPAFNMPRHTARMLQADLETAGIPYCDPSGRYADFHALRHTFITNLARSGVHPSTAQTLARHSTITLTMDRYTHTMPEQLTAALARLPDLSTEAMLAAGGSV